MSNNKQLLVSHYLNIGNYEKTVSECLDTLSDNPHNGFVLLCLSAAYRGLDRDEDCVKAAFDALKYLESEPYRAYVYNILGMERYSNMDYAKAAEYHKKSMELHPEDISYTANYAMNLAHLGQKDTADNFLKRAEEIEPNNESVLFAKIAIQYKYCKDRNVEEESISRYLLLSTQQLQAYYFFCLFHQKYGEYKTAYDYAVKAFLLAPNSAMIKNMLREFENLGYGGLMGEKYELIDNFFEDKNFKKVRAICLDTLVKHPNNGFILARLANACYELGRYDDCVEACIKALKYLEPNKQASICYLLGNERCVREDYIQAADYHKKAYDMEPSNLHYLATYICDLSYLGQTLPEQYKQETYQAVYDYITSDYKAGSYNYTQRIISYLKKFGYSNHKEMHHAEQEQIERECQEFLKLAKQMIEDDECREYLELAKRMREDELKRTPMMRLTRRFSQFCKRITHKKVKTISTNYVPF